MTRINHPFYRVVFTLCLAMPMNALAADTPAPLPGLVSLVNEALERNQEIRAMETAIEGMRSRAVFEGSLTDPQIGFSVSNLPVDSFDFHDEAMTQKQIFVGQKFPWPGKRALKSRTVEFEAEKLKYQLISKKLAITRSLAESYYDLGFIAESLTVNEDVANLVKHLMESSGTRYTSGKGNRQDMLMARLELDKRDDERIRLENTYRQIEDRINGILNREDFKPVPQPETPVFSDDIPANTALVAQARETSPELVVLKLDMEKSGTQKILAKKDYYPDVDMRLTYGQRDDDPLGRSRTDFVSLSAGLTLPLWKHQRQDSNLAAQESQEQSSRLKYQSLLRRIPHDVDRLATDIRETARRYRLYTNQLIPTAKDMARSSQSDYEVGKSEFSAMIKAQINALTLGLEAKNLLFLIAKKRAELDELIGLPFNPKTRTSHDTQSSE